MATYLYCVLQPPRNEEVPSGLTGVGDAPVRSLSFGAASGLVAWVSTVDEGILRSTGRALAEQALKHNEVVSAAWRTGRTPAPARYGSRFLDDAACLADLERRSTELSAILERIADSVEMPVLLVPTTRRVASTGVATPASGEPAAGKRYLESVRQRTRERERHRASADAEAGRLAAAIAPLIRGEVRSVSSDGVMSIAYLVENGNVARFKDALSAFTAMPAFRLLEGEMRAPYSFATPGLDHIGHDSSSRP